jgi:hypothetical protein
LPEFDGTFSVAVEDFGVAMLRGMNWRPGMGIGRGHKKDTVVLEIEPRYSNAGVGMNDSTEEVLM